MAAMSARRLRAVPLLALLVLAGSPLACSVDGTPCYPGDYRPCACDNGVRGLFQCSVIGDAYGACDCSGVLPGSAVDAGADTGAVDAADAGLRALFAPCSANAECQSGLCFHYASKGSLCSTPCAAPADCPTGCNMMNVCKAP